MRAATLAAAAAIAVASAVGCAAALRSPVPSDLPRAEARWPGTTLADLERGRGLYVRRCSSCHSLYLPTAYRAERWPLLVDGMAKKARLAPDEQRDLVRFLVTTAAADAPH